MKLIKKFSLKNKYSNGGNPCHPSKRLISVSHGGRLGNNMGEYATLWYYSKILNDVESFISPYMEKDLKKLFPHISLPVQKVPKSCWKKFMPLNAEQDDDKIVNIFERGDNNSLAFVYLKGYPNAINLFHRYRKDLLSEFRFSEHASANVEAFHNHLQSIYCQNSENCNQFLLVGIHVRRTDYQKWMSDRANQSLVNENYFLSAMRHMVGMIGKLKEHDKLMFVVASDDSKWCKAKFSQFEFNHTITYTIDYYPQVKKNYLDANNLSSCNKKDCKDAIGMEYVHFDLAVMSSMRYSIFDYGTFGFWGAYLSQSEITIAADLRVTDEQSKFLIKDKVVDAGVEGFVFLTRNYTHM